ncbi:MAG: hypothetical protein M3O09_15325 [Acidobacteriota bacterium]|nr:hypothetical protein [Acidobacteriota bacterium]
MSSAPARVARDEPMVRELTFGEISLILYNLAAAGDLEAGEILQQLLIANPVPTC